MVTHRFMIGKLFRFVIPKILVAASLVLAFWIGDATFKEMDRGKRIREEIESLHVEAQKTQKENTILREKIRYFQTDSFQEQEARDKLNYQRPDEQAVVIKPTVQENVERSEVLPDAFPSIDDKHSVPNYEKWRRHFFGA